MLHTHTHTPGRSRVNPERQEEGKSRHRRRAKGQNSARGGKGTNGPPEPTYAAKRTWQKQSTHLNPTTHYGEAQGKSQGAEWGLVGDGRETTKTINLKRTQFQLQQVSCVTPLRDRSQVTPKGKNSYTSSTELGAQYVQPHQTPSRERNHTCKHRPAFAVVSHLKHWSCGGKEVSGCSAQLQREKMIVPRDHKGPQERQDFSKGWWMKRPTVSLYLDELPS